MSAVSSLLPLLEAQVFLADSLYRLREENEKNIGEKRGGKSFKESEEVNVLEMCILFLLFIP